jgi:hypothetical protein
MARHVLSRRIGWLPAPSGRTLHLRELPAPFTFDPALGGLSAYFETARAKIDGRFPLLECIDVPIRRFDDVLTELGVERTGLLKIDVEGWEPQVLDSAEDSLRRADRLVLEVDRDKLASVEERLAAAGLTIRGVIDRIWNHEEMAVLYAERGFSGSPSGRPNRVR